MSLLRNGSCESLEMASSDSGASPSNSTHNSNSSIPSSLTTMVTNSSHSSGSSSSPPVLPSTPGSASKPKKFSLNLNGHSPSEGRVYLDSPDGLIHKSEGGIHKGNRYINKESLADDLRALSTMPELCDVTFLVGEDRQPVCGVRAILAARSRIFRKMLYADHTAVVGISKRIKKRQQQLYRSSDGYIEKYDFRGQPTVIVKDFEPEVFKQLIDYLHTGSVTLQARTLLGLMNASDHYCLEDLKQACTHFMERCITIDTVCSLLSSAEKYIQFKSTKILVQKMFEFVDANAETVLKLGDFSTLPQHVVRIVLGREELTASEVTKFESAYNWCLRHCNSDDTDSDIKKIFEPFVDVINYNMIPAKHLMQRVKASGVVDDSHILTALAYQADPNSIPTTRSSAVRPNRILVPMNSEGRMFPRGTGFRRIQSSGQPAESVMKMRRKSTNSMLEPRDTRASSVPITESTSGIETQDSCLCLRGSEVHPIKVHDVKEQMSSQSSSHVSILSTPPPSPPPTHSPSTNSIVSSSSYEIETAPLLSPGGSSNGSGNPTQPSNPKKKTTYNPHILDAIVNLSSTNAVEV